MNKCVDSSSRINDGLKSANNLKAKSLKVIHEKYKPALALRLSISDFRETDWLMNVPLYAVERVRSIIEMAGLSL